MARERFRARRLALLGAGPAGACALASLGVALRRRTGRPLPEPDAAAAMTAQMREALRGAGTPSEALAALYAAAERGDAGEQVAEASEHPAHGELDAWAGSFAGMPAGARAGAVPHAPPPAALAALLGDAAALLASLPASERGVLEALYLDGRSDAEVAVTMATTCARIRALRASGLAHLRMRLGERPHATR
jgi:DNA-directed RNA polymerase specialized sigma24 family protein